MMQELRAFVGDVVVAKKQGLAELLTVPTAYPSQQLATFYGFPAPNADYQPVTRPSGQGIGILATGAMLASHAQPDGSSPTQRGLFVHSRLLCRDRPKPPDNVPPVSEPKLGVTTTRQRYEELHAQGGCKGCHLRFDPIGFGFEHFDEVGRYRADEGGLPIDSASALPGLDLMPIFAFQGQEELARGLTQQADIYQCFASYLATYAYGSAEACLGTSRVAELKAGTVGIADYYAALAAEPHFTRRNAE